MSTEALKNAVKTTLLTAEVSGFQEKFAVLKIEGEEHPVLWPIKYLPMDVEVGSVVFIKIGAKEMEEEERAAIARKLLEELVN